MEDDRDPEHFGLGDGVVPVLGNQHFGNQRLIHAGPVLGQFRLRAIDALKAILLDGSVARGTEREADSDVVLLVVVSDAVDASSLEDRLRDLASDIELDRGIVLSLLVLSESDVDAQTDHPFFATVQREATQLHG
ncbi:hypothetical protein [Saliphagus infecundisoli]|uniref:hypothetical protein n=1 Tax=Saliphagus infecundisoli TaxID=1849069 RepID=UPI001CD2AB82|nr:hypothetical protein [Saliphagus infecundisoli]